MIDRDNLRDLLHKRNNIPIHLFQDSFLVCILYHIFYIAILEQFSQMWGNQLVVNSKNQILHKYHLLIKSIHLYTINIIPWNILNSILYIPSLSKGVKSGYRVEKEVSPPLEGSPVLWHKWQLKIVHSVQPVPIARKVFA
jgi:hypothetical protein